MAGISEGGLPAGRPPSLHHSLGKGERFAMAEKAAKAPPFGDLADSLFPNPILRLLVPYFRHQGRPLGRTTSPFQRDSIGGFWFGQLEKIYDTSYY
jgi:hypothetical protein